MSSFNVAAILDIPELPVYLEQVEKRIIEALASDNEHLNKSISHLLQVRGKRLRPSLVIAAATSQGGNVDDKVLASCASVELLHLASLVHDDIIDESATRWNIPTISAEEGSGQAILVGDYLLAKAYQEAAAVSAEAAQVIAATIADLTDGQVRELADKFNLKRTEESYLKSIHGKTAALFAASCRLGGLCAGSSKKVVDSLSTYGENFGMAFQLIDDALDFVSSPKLLGKPVGNDIAEGVYTMPLFVALAGPNRERVKTALQPGKASGTKLTELLLQAESISHTLHAARNYVIAADESLKQVGDKLALQRLPQAYLSWSLNNLVAPSYRPAVRQYLG
jgi:geranylgeranyl pyrophosphate synthase